LISAEILCIITNISKGLSENQEYAPAARDFFAGQSVFPQEYWMYFKGKRSRTAEKEPLIGGIDVFR
jgi:hypothetical protein